MGNIRTGKSDRIWKISFQKLKTAMRSTCINNTWVPKPMAYPEGIIISPLSVILCRGRPNRLWVILSIDDTKGTDILPVMPTGSKGKTDACQFWQDHHGCIRSRKNKPCSHNNSAGLAILISCVGRKLIFKIEGGRRNWSGGRMYDHIKPFSGILFVWWTVAANFMEVPASCTTKQWLQLLYESNKLLERQVKKFMPARINDDGSLRSFLSAVSESRTMLMSGIVNCRTNAFKIRENISIQLNNALKTENEVKNSIGKLRKRSKPLAMMIPAKSERRPAGCDPLPQTPKSNRKRAENQHHHHNRLSPYHINMEGILVEDNKEPSHSTNGFLQYVWPGYYARPVAGTDCSNFAE